MEGPYQKGPTAAAAIVATVTEITLRTASSTIPREETAMQLPFQVRPLLPKAFPPQTHLSQSLFTVQQQDASDTAASQKIAQSPT